MPFILSGLISQLRYLGYGVRAQAPLTLIVLAYTAGLFLLENTYGYVFNHNMKDVFLSALEFLLGFTVSMLVALTCVRFFYIVIYVKPKHPSITLVKDVWGFLSDQRRFHSGIVMFLLFCTFAFVFTQFKSAIPSYNPFSWDEVFMQLDYQLHFNHHAWELLQPVLGYGPITLLVNLMYNLWLAAMWVICVYLIFTTHDIVRRDRFFLCMILLWIVGGTILAIIFSSAGPCYYTRIGLSPDPYAPLMQYLNHVNDTIGNVWAIPAQNMLWDGYTGAGKLAGISAMPSLHNATALLFVLIFRDSRPWIRRILVVECFFIFVGSIHLGWHYATDAYAGWALTLIFWPLTKPLVRWWHARPFVERFNSGAYLAPAYA